jgi:excisionase family DNA binding protein
MVNLLTSPGRSPAKGIYVHIAARRIGCSDRSVRRYIQQGRLRAERDGRRAWVVFPDDVDSLCNETGEQC